MWQSQKVIKSHFSRFTQFSNVNIGWQSLHPSIETRVLTSVARTSEKHLSIHGDINARNSNNTTRETKQQKQHTLLEKITHEKHTTPRAAASTQKTTFDERQTKIKYQNILENEKSTQIIDGGRKWMTGKLFCCLRTVSLHTVFVLAVCFGVCFS